MYTADMLNCSDGAGVSGVIESGLVLVCGRRRVKGSDWEGERGGGGVTATATFRIFCLSLGYIISS